MSGNGVPNKSSHSRGWNACLPDPAERFQDPGAKDLCTLLTLCIGRGGEDGTLQGVPEVLGHSYTGSGGDGSAIGMDKWRTKMIWLSAGILTRAIASRRLTTGCGGCRPGPASMIVKPAREGSTLGLTKVIAAEQLPAAYDLAAQYHDPALAEEFIAGAEYTASILRDTALPLLIRIEAPEGNYDYQNK